MCFWFSNKIYLEEYQFFGRLISIILVNHLPISDLRPINSDSYSCPPSWDQSFILAQEPPCHSSHPAQSHSQEYYQCLDMANFCVDHPQEVLALQTLAWSSGYYYLFHPHILSLSISDRTYPYRLNVLTFYFGSSFLVLGFPQFFQGFGTKLD